MDFFYDGQIRRYVTQFMRIFIGFKAQSGDGEQKSVPVMYGDLTRQVASIIKENSENKLPTVPRMACYITGLELDTRRLSDPSFVSKVNIRERKYTLDSNGTPEYTGEQGANYTVERLMPTPFTLTMKTDIWTSNTDQKLQLLEQMLVLFSPSLDIQSTDNYIDWTSLTTVYLTSSTFSSRTIPAGVDSDIDICSLEFTMPIYISPPAKVKKLGIVQTIIANIFTDTGDIQDLQTLVYNTAEGDAQVITPAIDYGILLLKSNNGQPYDYDVTLVDTTDVIRALTELGAEIKTGKTIDWNTIINFKGGYRPGNNIYFKQPNGYEMVGTYAINPANPEILVVTFDQDTIPTNTLLPSTVVAMPARGTIDAIIDPLKFNPITTWGSLLNIPLGTRYLMLDDVNNSVEVGTAGYDGPDAWKNIAGGDSVIYANSIIEWNGSSWAEVFDPDTGSNPTYIQNIRTGIQYKWNGEQWLKSFEGEYAPGFWRFDIDSV